MDPKLGFTPVIISKTSSRKVFVCCGEELPDITSQLDDRSSQYYYTSLLTLFKPHRKSTLLLSESTVLATYSDYLHNGDLAQVQRLRAYEEQWHDYYRAQRSDQCDSESPESQLLRTRSPATTTWYPMDDEPRNNVDPVEDVVPDDFVDVRAVVTPESSTTKLILDAKYLVKEIPALKKTLKMAGKGYPSARTLELNPDFSTDSYDSLVMEAQDVAGGADCVGTQEFIAKFQDNQTRLERMQELFASVPYEDLVSPPRWTPLSLPSFPKISEVSEAFQLNFWQHVVFETTARHLLYAYFEDITEAISEPIFPLGQLHAPCGILPQLVGYIGGEAGTGKSTVVEALLTFAKMWGRKGSVETLAFTGVAAINIKGRTMHSARNLLINGAEPKTAPTVEMKAMGSITSKVKKRVRGVLDGIGVGPACKRMRGANVGAQKDIKEVEILRGAAGNAPGSRKPVSAFGKINDSPTPSPSLRVLPIGTDNCSREHTGAVGLTTSKAVQQEADQTPTKRRRSNQDKQATLRQSSVSVSYSTVTNGGDDLTDAQATTAGSRSSSSTVESDDFVWTGGMQCGRMAVVNNAPVGMDQVLQIDLQCPTRTSLSPMELHVACRALKMKLDSEKGNKRQCGRRLKSEPFKLSNSQIMLHAHRYKAARCEGRPVDYTAIAGSMHFPTFKGHAQILQAKEPQVVQLLESAFKGRHQGSATKRVMTDELWKTELDKRQQHYEQQLAVCQMQMEHLRRRLESEVMLSNDLGAKLVKAYTESKAGVEARSNDAST